MKVAIVILNWNGRKMLERYLPLLVAWSGKDSEVIVADNASTDDSMAWLSTHMPEVRTILLDKNYGFADGYNKALSQVKAEYYVLINSDVEVNVGWLTPLVTFMDCHPEAAACQPKLLAVANRKRFEYAGACGGYIDKLGYPFCRGRLFNTVEKDEGQYDTIAEVAWATGACLMVRSKDYWDANGLDGRFFAHNEEIDFCWRLRLMGRKIYCVPQSVVYHVGGGTLPQGNPRKTYLNFRNNLTMLYKNLPEKELKGVMCKRWVLDYVAAFQTLLVNGNWRDFMAIWRARRDFKRWKKDFQADRERIQAKRKVQIDETRSDFSLLWRYYVKGCRTFRSLGLSVLCALLVFALASCELKLKTTMTDTQNSEIKVARYDRLQSRYLSTGDFSALQEMNTEYPVETRTLIERVLQIGDVVEPDISTKFLRFFQDSTLQVLMSDAELQYADMEDINKSLNKVFERMRGWIPDLPYPKVYAQLGALDQSIIIGDRSIGICLDKYLGENYPLYLKYYPEQARKSMTRAHIVPDCLTFYMLSLYPMPNFEQRKQIEKDLHLGKVMWASNKALGYRFFDTRYVRIVDKYMRKHQKVSLKALLESDDYSKMLP